VGENIRLNCSVSQEVWRVLMDPMQLDQILANLAVNARDAIAGTGEVFIEVVNCTLHEADCRGKPDFVTPGDYVALTIRDTGTGMTPEVQAHIFEPFFTTKGVGKGTGLGLATVYGIVRQNNGAITVQSAPGQGTTFTIHLPRAGDAALAAADEPQEPMPTGTETVLLVEDEEPLLQLVHRALVHQGYRVVTATAPRLALQVCEQHPGPIHLLLTDVIMPDLGGKELAERIQALRPGIRVLFMSGYTADFMEEHGHLPANLDVLQKPFPRATLAQRVRAALDAPPPPRQNGTL
jgi:two-component system, cell cycle sensor histidine kinase and response regulator CckA